MASASTASEFGNCWIYIADEIRLETAGLPGDFHRHLDGFVVQRDGHLGAAVFEGTQNSTWRNVCGIRVDGELHHPRHVHDVAGFEPGGDEELGVIIRPGKVDFRRQQFQRNHLRTFGQ